MAWLRMKDNDLHESAVNLDLVTLIDDWDSEYTRIWFCGDPKPFMVKSPFTEVIEAIYKIGEKE